MRLTRTRTLQALAAAALIAFTSACAGAPPVDSSPAPSVSQEAVAQPTETEAPTLDVPDPRGLAGVTSVQSIGAIEPISGTPETTLPASVTGDDGVDVTIESIERIVTLDVYGTISQTIIGLGLGDNIVGRTVTDTDPAVADAALVTNGAHTVNVEAVLEVRPTLLLLDTTLGPASTQHVLRDAGVDVVVLDPDRRADLIDDQIRMIASAVGAPEDRKSVV